MEDWELVAAAMQGDRRALAQLMDVAVPHVYPLAFSILKNRPDAEDAVHEAVISAMNGIAKLKDPEKFKAWFLRITANRALNIRNVQQRDLQIDDGMHRLPGVQSDLDCSIDIREAIDSLPEFHKQTVILHCCGLTTEQIADTFERPSGTVRRVLSEAYRMLSQTLGPDYDYRNKKRGPRGAYEQNTRPDGRQPEQVEAMETQPPPQFVRGLPG